MIKSNVAKTPKRNRSKRSLMSAPPTPKTSTQNTSSEKPLNNIYHDTSRFTEQDIYLFREGKHFRLYDKLGAHIMTAHGVSGTYFAVWAPNAKRVAVIGNFNGWNPHTHALEARWDSSGIWEGFIPNIGHGVLYKYLIESHHNNYSVEKKDPFAFCSELPPKSASIVWDINHQWDDVKWMQTRKDHNALNAPFSIYEVHCGSWKRKTEDGTSINYREMAEQLPKYLNDMGFTHVEFMPLMEHPFYGSWGYQTTGYFEPTNRYGNPEDLMYLIDELHRNDIGVIFDWVPSHFPSDEHGLAFFDGTHLFEHGDPKKGFHPDWNCYIFNHGRHEVRSFLTSSALFWLDKYHIDGLRVDAVASMLYLDYSRKEGEWIPNMFGGRENLDSIDFLKCFNHAVYESYPDVQTIAEESTSWPMVSRPAYMGGLGFGMKWNMGWMHDTLVYFSKNPAYRKHHHNELIFSQIYAFTENFVLSLSHDEVVHGKGSLLRKMPEDDWQKFANLRLLYGYMYGHPGKKLLFMGAEFGQWDEWYHEKSIDWHLLQCIPHQGIHRTIRDLNHLYKTEKALYESDFDHDGFEWIDFLDWESSILCFLRKCHSCNDKILVVCNFTPVPRHDYRVGVPHSGFWKEIFNSDASHYDGSGKGNCGGLNAQSIPFHGRNFSVSMTLPPLGAIFLKWSKS